MDHFHGSEYDLSTLVKIPKISSHLCHREELQTSQREVDELRGKLRMQMSLLSGDPDAAVCLAGGLCIKCAQNEAVLAVSAHGNVRESLEKVSRCVA